MYKRILFIIAFVFSSIALWAQSFINGSFEINTAVSDKINLNNSGYNSYMANSKAFGTIPGNVDIITSATYCDVAQDGKWYVALTGGGTDAISLELSSPLKIGNEYTISFYDRATYTFTPEPFTIGLSINDTTFGTPIYTAPIAIDCIWTKRTFSFIAPNNGKFITVKNVLGDLSSWTQVDNFVMEWNTTIENQHKESFVRIYPNPVNTELNIAVSQGPIKMIQVINNIGQIVLSVQNAQNVNVSNLAAGVYVLKLQTENDQLLFASFVKQ